ncbi:TetR/AcrR family transcriptional regulator [Cellulomonas humilata]|uniref:TetR/AcrR family transcriptional regulator n=2 Tax=Cellulomonas TaxID=1707 RepID=A0A7Y5ZZT8_9CELL|nr:TetR/AcrR family transcriptional regulator [Cellulomonas humilata]NUU15829.1 TetR/AcrR family transcriptional regulator [Cellulomonas humilata]
MTTAAAAAPRLDPRVARSRAAVLTATVQLLIERGIAGATVEAVAARSGVAKTTIYRQWPDQPSLVLDAFSSLLAAQEPPDTGTLREDLLQMLRGLAAALTTSPAAALMPALIDAAERQPAYRALHHREAEARHSSLRTVLGRGIERGELPPGTEVDLLVDLLAGPLFHRRWVSDRVLDDHFATAVVDTVLLGTHRSPHSNPRTGGPRC